MATKQQKQVRITKKQLDIARSKTKIDPRDKEPKTIDQDNYSSSLVSILTYYRLEFDTKTKKQWTLDYLDRIHHPLSKTLSKINNQYFETIGALVRMHENGVVLRDSIESRIEKLAIEISQCKHDDESQLTTKLSTPIPKGEVAESLLGEFEGYLDDHLGKKSLNLVSWTKQYSPTLIEIEQLKTLIEKKLNEYTLVSNDKELLSAYDLTKKQCGDIIKSFTDAIIELSAAYQRKPRTKKEIPIQKLVEKVQYLKCDNELGLTSIDPSNIIGKTMLVTFNTKTRKVQIYRAIQDQTLSIKGTTLLNFDEETSKQKTIRNPKEQFLNMMQLTKRGIEKAFDVVKSVDTTPTGRINEDTLICKVF